MNMSGIMKKIKAFIKRHALLLRSVEAVIHVFSYGRFLILSLFCAPLWFFLFLVGGDWIYRIHSRWFEITKRDFDLMNYFGMALLKISILTFFLIPYLSIRLTLRSNPSAN